MDTSGVLINHISDGKIVFYHAPLQPQGAGGTRSCILTLILQPQFVLLFG